ncbi:MAG: hypothetical protein QM719_06720 [Thermomonas sp.]
MNRWALIGAVVCGGLFALSAYLRLEILDSRGIRALLVFFLFGAYCGIVIVGTSDKKHSLSLFAQTFLGVLAAIAIAAICKAGMEGFEVAALIGLILGFTADKWIRFTQFLP